MTLEEFCSAVADVCGKTDPVSLTAIKRALERRYRMIYDAHLWRDALALMTVAAGDDELIMPAAIDRVVAVRWDSMTIFPIDQQTLFQVDPQIFERSGTPLRFSRLTPVALAQVPAAAERLRLVSSSTADTSQVLIRGELAGVEQVETVSLGGLTPVFSSQSFDIAYTIAKSATAGTVTITGKDSAANYLQLWAEERERKYPRIRLHEQPSDLSKNLLILGKRRRRPMTHDLDTPLLLGIDNALLAFGRADEWKRQRQYAKALAEAQEGEAQLRIALDLETNQSATIVQLIPADIGGYDDGGGEWGPWVK